jgi:hypothetical protein
MTQATVLADNEQQINFLNLFIRSKTTPDNEDALAPKSTVLNPILDWFDKSAVLAPVTFKSIAAGKIFQSDRAIVKFKLSGIYHNHFVQFRGLLEFSRPKWISVSFNNSERTFEFFVGMDQANAVTEYLDLILKLLVNEINFKKYLKSILRFEESVRVEQSRLYRELRASSH